MDTCLASLCLPSSVTGSNGVVVETELFLYSVRNNDSRHKRGEKLVNITFVLCSNVICNRDVKKKKDYFSPEENKNDCSGVILMHFSQQTIQLGGFSDAFIYPSIIRPKHAKAYFICTVRNILAF